MSGSPIDRLYREPWRFDFFQAVRLLEAAARRDARDPRFDPAKAVGEDAEPKKEVVRLKVPSSLSFAPSQVVSVIDPRDRDDGPDAVGPPEMTVSVLGLTGPSGAMPQHYTESLIADVRSRSFGYRDFLDVFNHRMLSLMMRGWEKYRLTAAYERHGAGGNDPVSQALYALVGFGTDNLKGRLALDDAGKPRISDEVLLHYSGHFAHWPRSAAGLRALLSDFFGRPVDIDQLSGQWITLSPDEVSSLPTRERPDGAFCALGVDAVAGTRVWDIQSSFLLRVGPLSYASFTRFMPDGDELIRIAHLVRLYVGPHMRCDVRVSLKREDVPPLVMGGDTPPRLGWNTWMPSTIPLTRDPDDAVYRLDLL